MPASTPARFPPGMLGCRRSGKRGTPYILSAYFNSFAGGERGRCLFRPPDQNRITQAELAQKVNVSRQTIIAIEQGKFNPSVRLALMLGEFFGCQVEDLFYLEKDEKK